MLTSASFFDQTVIIGLFDLFGSMALTSNLMLVSDCIHQVRFSFFFHQDAQLVTKVPVTVST